MNSDRATGRTNADEVDTKRSIDNGAVHLDIDGTMDLSNFSTPRQPRQSIDLNRSTNEAELRHVIRLQRQALNKQSQRIDQQRTLIARLNRSLKQMHRLHPKHRISNWLRSVFTLKNKLEKQSKQFTDQ